MSKKVVLLILLVIAAPTIYFGLSHYYKVKQEQDFPFLKAQVSNSFGDFNGTVTFKNGKPVKIIVPKIVKRNPFPGNQSI